MANYREEARRAARRHGLNPSIFERQINQESGFAQDVITGRRKSSAGALGIAQFMPATARNVGVDPLNPKQALDGAARLMSSYVKKYGNYKDALVAYNAGPGGVGHPPAESRNYVSAILGGKNPPVSRGRQASSSGRGKSGGTITTPGVSLPSTSRTVNDPAAEARVIAANFLAQRNPNNLLLRLGILNPNEATTRTVRTPGINIPTSRLNIPSNSSGRSSGGSVVSGRGGVAKITGPNPGRIVPQVKSFMEQISAVRGGKPVVGSDGTGHSYLTVNGNVSEHSTGHASDIPARGGELIHLGQAALIAAGMPRSQARKQRGGLFNVQRGKRRYQIIFNTHEGGDHTDHLHVGVKG